MSSFTKSEKGNEEQFTLLFWAQKGKKHVEKNKFKVNHS